MLAILNSLFPVFAVIVIGYVLKHYKFLENNFWPSAEKLAYYILLPVLLFYSISTASFRDAGKFIPMIFSGLVSISFIAASLLVFMKISKIKMPDFTSIFQGAVYANAAYIGIPSALALYGKEGMVIYALLMAILVPFVNSLTIIVLSIFSDKKLSPIEILKKIALHPIIMACLGGLLLNLSGVILPKAILNTLEILGKAAMPIGLIIVGGALDIKAIKGARTMIFASSFIKLFILPLITLAICQSYNVSVQSTQIVVLYTSLPAAAATYLLARKMGGNAPLMAGIIVTETLTAFFSIALMARLVQLMA